MDIARITVLVDNCVQGRDLLGEHGLAFRVEVRGRCLLFDTGQGAALPHNADRLGVELEQITAVAMSHGHYDHTGALAGILKLAPQARVYAHPAAFDPKYSRTDDGDSRDVGMPSAARSELNKRRDAFCPTRKPTEICEGVFVTGEIPRRTRFETTGGSFFTDPGGEHPDPLLDDQAMYLESPRGTVVLLGCAHAGVINTLRYVRKLTGGKPIHAVLGGMHLMTASRERMDRTTDALRRLKIGYLVPAHCTGMAATARLWNALPGRCHPCGAGLAVEFKLS